MIAQIEELRDRCGRLLLVLIWAHVPIIGLVTLATDQMSSWTAMSATAILAIIYHLAWLRHGIAPITRYVSTIALIAEPSLLLLVLEGHPWQMDLHMYFYAMIALSIAWFDRAALLLAALVTILHHLILSYLFPMAVFSTEGDFARVLLHGGIVGVQTTVQIWVSNMITDSFQRIDRMQTEIMAKSKALEERSRDAEEAAHAKSMFLANISHEIRTPINAILGFCHLIQRTALEPHQADQVAKISTAGTALLRLINDILDFSKNDAGKLTLEAREFNLGAAISCQAQMVAEEANAKGLDLRIELDPSLPETLIGDELRLNQVVLNLLNNAVKFTLQGSVVLSARMVSQEEGEALIECTVADTGIGIEPGQQAQLFLPFSQADSSTTRRFGGTGLGLAICYQIVQQMGGSIRVDSIAGQGSAFTFGVRLGVGSSDATMPSPAVQSLKVLVADDNPIARQMLSEIFSRWQMQADLTSSGPDALAMLADHDRAGDPYHLFIVDWKMPGMDGLQALRTMRRTLSLATPPATLVTTSYAMEDLIREAADERDSLFLAKPINPAELLETLKQVSVKVSGPSLDRSAPRAALTLPDELQGLKVLLAEDNEINREIAVALLTDAGLLVECASNGLEACRMVGANHAQYAAVLMDLQMPQMDGLAAARQIRRQHSADVLPIIAMTAHALEEERKRCVEAGMVEHVTKPVDPARLVAVLGKILRPGSTRARPVLAPAVARGSLLPDMLPPFNIAAALQRVNGKAELLRRLILSFGENYALAPSEIADLVDGGKLEEAGRLAHTLKGVAASLELAEVPAIAQQLEQQINARQLDGIPALVAALRHAISPAITASASLAGKPAPAGASSAQPSSSSLADQRWAMDPAEFPAQHLLEALRGQIARRSLAARQSFEALADALRLQGAERQDHPLRLALQRLDYGAAVPLLEELALKTTRDPRYIA